METSSGSGAGQEPPVAAQPPPSPLSGAYLLIVVGEPHTDAHKQDILRKIANGFLSWDVDSCHVALEKELQAIIAAAPEGEEARNGERLIQFASENLVTEVLIQPQLNTLIQCIRNLLSSFTKHRHIIHAGYTFAGNGSWIVQDGTFSLADLIDALQEPEVQRVLRAYEHSVTVDIHCAPEGDWSTARLRREACTRLCRVRVNPDDSSSPAANIQQFVDYLAPFVRPQSIDQLLHPSDVVGNIRFSHPTLYVFPGGQGDAALFGINGFNMLVDGGFARKACFWDFVRHLDRLDAVLMTRINNSNCHGLASILRRKRLSHVYPQIGHFFCNLQERKQPSTPDEEKVRDPLLVNLLDEGQEMVQNLKHLQLKPHNCVRDSVLEPINLYHKVGHGKLDMYVISPAKDSKDLKEFLSKWHSNDISLFNSVLRKSGDKDISFPFQNLVSICALLVWQPANPEDTITRILFPGSTPQHKIFEGLEKLRSLDFMKQPVCTAKTLSPSSSTLGINTKVSKTKSTPAVIDKLLPGEGLSKPIPKGLSQTDPVTKQTVAKAATIPVSGTGESKAKPVQPPPPKTTKPKSEKQKQEKDNKTEVDKNIEVDAGENIKQDKPVLITDQLKEKESTKIKNEKTKAENKPKKIEGKVTSRVSEKKPPKVPSIEKKDSVKSSPTTPKKSVEAKMNGVGSKAEIVKSTPKPKLKTSPSSTPAKSTKEENNRKVVESKAKAAIASKTSAPKPKRDESVVKVKQEKKSTKKPLSSSPIKLPSKTFSPLKGATKTVSKGKKDSKKLKGDIEKGIVTDSSTVSTPSTVDAETAIAKEGKGESKEKTEEVVKKDIDSGKLKEKEKLEDETSKDIDESAESKEKAEDVSVSEDIISTDKQEDKNIDTSEKEFSEKEEEDEILIIEKVEIEQYGDDSVQDQESLESHIPDDGEDEIQKHLRDEAESEKKKDDQHEIEEIKVKEENEAITHDDQNKKDIPSDHDDKEVKPGDLTLTLTKETATEKLLTPENREQIEEEVQEIITSATDFVSKAKLEQSKESSELSADGIGSDEQKTSGETKDFLSSPEKLQILSDKNFTDDDNKQDDTKDRSKETGDIKYGAEESQPDEKISTTVESGATTAPTLPEDERIPLDEIKEGIEEKYDKEDTKEKEILGTFPGRIEQPTTLPQVSIIPGGPYEVQATQMLRDIVKTPDEVADLPVHEEVDGVYEEDDFSRYPSKSKEDLQIISGKKEADFKEEKQYDVAEKKVTLEKVESIPKDMPILSTDETAKQAEIREDIRQDEEELNELKIIRQNLEAEDAKQELRETHLQSPPKGSEIESKHEMVLETEPVHSMLKAPEVAELVMVTPDSAPDSPLHVSTEKKDKTDSLPVIDGGQDGKPLEHITDLGKEPLHTIKNDEIEESVDTIVGLKKIIDTPKTPPASPVFGDISKEKEKIDVSPDIVELNGISEQVIDNKSMIQVVSETIVKSDLHAIPESSSPIQGDDVDTDLVEKDSSEPNKQQPVTHIVDICSIEALEAQKETDKTSSGRPQSPTTSTLLSGDKKEEFTLKAQETSESNVLEIPADIGESPKLEKEQIVKEKIESPRSASPRPSSKEDVNQSGELIEEAGKLEPSEPVDKVELKASEKGTSDADVKAVIFSSGSAPGVESEIKATELKSSSTEKTKLEKHDSPKPLSPVPSDKGDGELRSSDNYESPKSVSPVPYDKESVVRQTMLDKHDSPKSTSPIPSDKEDTKITEKHESPKSISPVPAGKEIGTDQTKSERHDSPKSVSPVPSDKEDAKITEKGDTPSEKHDSPKSVSPIPASKEIGTEESKSEKHDSPKSISPVPSGKGDAEKTERGDALSEKHDSPKRVSPVPSGKETALEQTMLGEHDSPKSVSPVPSDKEDAKITVKPDSPKSGSPIPASKEIGTEESKSEKHDSPKSISPVLSGKEGAKITEKGDALSEKHDSPKRVSPVPSGKETGLEQTMLEKHDSPKSVSPIPCDSEDAKIPEKYDSPKSISPIPASKETGTEETKSERRDSPKSISPVPSGKGDAEITVKGEALTEEYDSPKSVSPVPSGKETALEQTTMEKHDSPKSISPMPCDKEDAKTTEKHDSPKSFSPIPAGKETSAEQIKSEKDESPKSISPVPSDKRDVKIIEKEDILPKHDSPENVSPERSGKEAAGEQAMLEKHDSPKTTSPIPSDKGDAKITEKHSPPKSISPVPADKETGTEPTKSEKHDSPKTISPVPSEKGDAKITEKGDALSEKHDSPKSVSPVPSGQRTAVETLEKHDSPQSISPTPSDKEDAKITEKHESPKSISPVLAGKEIGTEQTKSEKHDSPKSISPVPSDKADAKITEKGDDLSKKHDSPKSVSPVPTGQGTAVEMMEKHDSPKSISPVPSDKGAATEIEKQESPKRISPVSPGKETDSEQIKTEKHDSPKSISPVPSDKGDAKITEKGDDLSEKHDSPKSVSPIPSGQATAVEMMEKHDSPKSISPIPSDKGAATKMEKQESPKSISPVPAGKESDSEQIKSEKHDSPRSISPVPSGKGDAETTAKGDALSEKHDSPKSVSPVPSGKETAVEMLEKHDSPKSFSPIPSDKDDVKMTKLHDSPKSISPIPAGKEIDTEQTKSEMHESSKSICPVPSDKGGAKITERGDSLSKQDSPQSVSPVPSSKDTASFLNEEPKIKEKDDILSEKHDSPKSVRSISPVSSDKRDIKTPEKVDDLSDKHESSKSVSPAPATNEKATEQTIAEKKDTPKSISPMPSDKEDVNTAEKHDSPKSISPIPACKETGTEQTKSERYGSPKSISPMPSDKGAVKITEEGDASLVNYDSPKSVSPAPCDKGAAEEQTMVDKHDSPKSISPVHSDKGDADKTEKRDSQKSTSPTPAGEKPATEQSKLEKLDSPKSISPVPSDKGYSLSEKHDSPKSVSPVPSGKEIVVEQTILEKHDSPKSISPVPSEKGDEKINEKHDSSKSISPIPDDKETATEQTKLEKLDSPVKSISPVPSDKGDAKITEKGDALSEKHDSAKGFSHVASDKGDGKPVEKADTFKEKSDTSKGISPEPSKMGDGKIAEKSDLLSEKHDSPSVSPIPPSKKIEEKQTMIETHEGPKSLSTISSGKGDGKITDKGGDSSGKLDSPKSVSPVPSDKETTVEQTVVEKQDSLTSISPVFPEKGDERIIERDISSQKQETPKSTSPLPSGKDISKDTVTEQTMSERGDSPKSVHLGPADKLESVEIENEQSFLKKHESPKSISPVPSDKGDGKTVDQYVEKHDTLKSVSPDPTCKADVEEIEINQAILGKHDCPKSISPDPSDILKQTILEDHISPKSTSPLPSNEETKSLKTELSDSEKHDVLKSISPVPPETSDNRQSENYDAKKHDSSKTISPNNKDDSKIDDLTEPEKADTELSEKEKSKDKLNNQLTDDSYVKESVVNVNLNEKQNACEISGTDQKNGLQESETNGNLNALGTVSRADQMATNFESTSSSSSYIVEGKPSTVTTDEQLGSSDSSSTTLSIVSYQTPLSVNGKHDTSNSNVVLCTGDDAVIEETLQSKSIKTEKDVKADSESTVPSNIISSGLDSTLKESSNDLSFKDGSSYSSADHRPTKITEPSSETKSGLHSVDISSVSISKGDKPESLTSTKDEVSSSIHRMLVTGSSEDGGTETELCSSSVIKLPDGSYDTNLGNVVHIPQEDLATYKQDPTYSTENRELKDISTSSTVPDPPPEKTIITTTVHTTSGQKEAQIKESTKPSDVVKTITTTITKTFGDHPTTDIKTTEEIVLSSGEKSSLSDAEKKNEAVSSGILSQSLKKEMSDAGRSGTPASDLASERELETGGISTPHSDISSGQVSRAATHVWGESSEGRPDSRHCDSDDDIPCSPMSATSHVAQSPPQFDFDIHQHAKEGFLVEKPKSKDSSLPAAMTSSFYGSLPDDPLDEYMKDKPLPADSQMYSSMYVSKYGDDNDDEEESKPVISGTVRQSGVTVSKTEGIDFETAIKEHRSVRGEDLTVKYTNGKPETSVNGKSTSSVLSTNGLSNGKSSQPESLEFQESQSSSAASSNVLPKSIPSQLPISSVSSSSPAKPSIEEKKDPIEGWGKPLGLPPPPKNLIDSPLSQSTLTLVWNPADEWGLPLGLPSPAPPPTKKDSMNGEIDAEITSNSNRTTPKKVARRNAENNKSASNTLIGKEASNKSKHPESPVKRASNKDAKSKSVSPVYMDLTYVPHHGNSNYTNVEFFKRIRARYYVFSGTEPSKEVFNALLEAKQTWEDKDLEVTIIPTYDTDTLGYWVAENEDLLAKYKIDLSPSASRCTINLQDHETSCSAYRLEF